MATVTYCATVNLGSYESERIELVAEIDDPDTVETAVRMLRGMVEAATLRPGFTDRHTVKATSKDPDPFDGIE